MKNQTLGVVMAGGESRRMGRDKSLMQYHGMPQREFVYNMLSEKNGGACAKTIIIGHADRSLPAPGSFELLYDLPEYDQTGPIGGLLTAFAHFPEHDLLVVGCDYPYLRQQDLASFMACIDGRHPAAAFCNKAGDYEPLLAWYSREMQPLIMSCFQNHAYSLRRILEANNAQKFACENPDAIKSVDTFSEYCAFPHTLSSAGC